MSGRELDPDGTDSYHPQHPWEQSGHEQYINPRFRTKENWPPDPNAKAAGPYEARIWRTLPGRAPKYEVADFEPMVRAEDAAEPVVSHFTAPGIGIGKRVTSKKVDLRVTGGDFNTVVIDLEAIRIEAREEGIREGVRQEKERRKKRKKGDSEYFMFQQNVWLVRSVKERLDRIAEEANRLLVQAEISDSVKYGTLSTATVREAMKKILKDTEIER